MHMSKRFKEMVCWDVEAEDRRLRNHKSDVKVVFERDDRG